MSRLSWFVARRYLASRKKGQFLSFITWIALGGITVGVTALIVVLAVMNGMQEDLRANILEASPHIYVTERGSALRLENWPALADSVRAMPQVTAAQPFALSSVVIVRDAGDDYAQPADLYGVATEGSPEAAVTEVERDILRGVYDVGPTESGFPPVVLGSRLAARIQAAPGDTILTFSLENINLNVMGTLTPTVRQFEVTGTVETGMYDYDLRNMYAPLGAVQGLLGFQESETVSGLGVRTVDANAAAEVASELQRSLGIRYAVESWTTTNQSLFAALELEKLAMGVILFLIVMVAAFNIVSTLVMVVVDRTSEIGILKSMGMTDRQVLGVFVLQGVTIGVLGTAIGTGLGLLLSWILETYDIIRIPPDVYFIERLPVSVQLTDVVLIVVISILISLVATIYPALQASRLQPVEAIRHE